jgi:Ni,Fe-hydrogenase III large subunit
VIEALGDIDIPRKAMTVRGIGLELERAAVHTGDLGAIANDIAYLTGSAVYGAIRTLLINTSLAICGSRFGRGLLAAGGVNYDIDKIMAEKIKITLKKAERDIDNMTDAMLSQASVLSRLEQTGILTK